MDTLSTEPILIFTTLRVPFIALFLTILFNFLVIILLGKKVNIKQLAFINLLATFFVSVSLLAQQGVIVDQFGLGGDPFSFYLVLISAFIFFLAVFFFTSKEKKKGKDNK